MAKPIPFSEPHCFGDGDFYVVSQRAFPTKEEAKESFEDWLDEQVSIDKIYEDYVRYGKAPEETFSDEEECYYLNAKPGRGAIKVWVLER